MLLNDLWKLPPELRWHIYLHAFAVRQDEQKGDYTSNRLDLRLIGDRVFLTPSKSRKYRNRGHHALPLLRTCKRICSEATPALYSSLEFKLILGSIPSRGFWHDELVDIDLGNIEGCALLRHIRILTVSLELKTKWDAEALIDEQCDPLINALPCVRSLEIRHTYAALFLEVPTSYDYTILATLRPLLGDDLTQIICSDDEGTRRFTRLPATQAKQCRDLPAFAAARIPGCKKLSLYS
ncbi:uncharacterized protein MYCFIDRAFT_210808 [Pseudocercospora fijiensis CIRAD86]|uniref:Uncharacterized protein n=1 Tax=Pseudocercospora fijiensis (strain CIRAD86) TaxID=383855 RepID=M2ZZ37_PSEFD|nr:uncharacterized protein MYCFIDRAFT_210808 [Pseudocercospora fijiensis CIRAD86]EME84189.1 hypothetical protein MYCFIDRAFT_210808 [Pseudocercospora fijiensis CIRAD86]